MTLEERIKNALDKCALSGWRLSVLQTEIACMAQAAVEEDRKTRECCKTEREACAMIADDLARRTREEWEENPLLSLRGTENCEAIRDAIRARSDS